MAIGVLILLAKRRGMGRYIKGNIDVDIALGTLAAKTLATQAPADVVEEKAFVSSIRATWSMGNFTPGVNRGPIMVGYAHSDYSAAEIEAWVERSTSWAEGDKVSQEISNRFIRRVGVLPAPVEVSAGIGTSVLNDGKAITTKLGWLLTTGQTIDLWVYNLGSAALADTDPNVHVEGHANIWPR